MTQEEQFKKLVTLLATPLLEDFQKTFKKHLDKLHEHQELMIPQNNEKLNSLIESVIQKVEESFWVMESQLQINIKELENNLTNDCGIDYSTIQKARNQTINYVREKVKTDKMNNNY